MLFCENMDHTATSCMCHVMHVAEYTSVQKSVLREKPQIITIIVYHTIASSKYCSIREASTTSHTH